MDTRTYLSNAEIAYIDGLYEQYQNSPSSLDYGWQKFFEGFNLGQAKNGSETNPLTLKEIKVLHLIRDYRTRGHLFTKTNPVRTRRQYFPTLDIENYGLDATDLETEFEAGTDVGLGKAKLKDIIELLNKTYCESIGAEYVYIRTPERVEWLKNRMESSRNTPKFSIDEKRHILNMLNKAVVFENFLNTKFVGQKRFSLEGAENTIAALDAIINKGAELGIEEFNIGMAHRGRLNVLSNILRKSYTEIFSEFEGKAYEEALFEGDVKYHLGFSSNVYTPSGKSVHLSLVPNPSHLEAVNPVVEGLVRAKLENKYQGQSKRIAPILIHGDASVAGQGIIYETLQMSGLDGYATGGTIHLVINNQVGFTTNYYEGRTSTYCTDVAKTTLCPVFHVNGDDAEAVVFTVQLALEYRQQFHTDVFIDLLCYRKYGHNEGDEPRFTQPLLYKIIQSHPNPREIYSNRLMKAGSIEADLAREMEKEFKQLLQKDLDTSKEKGKVNPKNVFEDLWKGYKQGLEADFFKTYKTTIAKKTFLDLADRITSIPPEFKPFNKIEKLFADRKAMLKNNKLDWAMGELMAYATLLNEGHGVRISGQDVERGTFSHRHAIIKREDSEEKYSYLNHLSEKQAKFTIHNSLLSEYGVLGFEYGYAMATPEGLSIWEAQFGDFGNGAQIIIDQFISCGEAKWKTKNGLVMLLPHGYEGQGPEHSSARMERFLQLCGGYNMTVCNVTSPANMYHLLRQQVKRDFRVPLVVFTPKSLLRHPACVSSIDEFTSGAFQHLIDDDYASVASKVKRVLFCSGKIYYDLLQHQKENTRKDIAIVRLEQLYPMPEKQMDAIFKKYRTAEFCWVQEEPKNMGAWTYLLRREENYKLRLISRKTSPSPATGYNKVHLKEQDDIIKEAFGK